MDVDAAISIRASVAVTAAAAASGAAVGVENATLDLETYIASYSGHTRIQRLVFVGDRCPALRLEAYRLALRELQDNTQDTKRIAAVAEKLREAQRRAGVTPLANVDREQLAALDRQTAGRTERLEQELKNYKNNLIKESIRMGYNDLGDHYYRRGDLENALKCYVRTRDYCTNSKHITQMCLNVVRVSVELHNFAHVVTYANKALATPDIKKEPVTVAKLTAVLGLYHLERGDYRQAAHKFLETTFDLHGQYGDVLAGQDVGTYGVLCALATLERDDLRRHVLESAAFKPLLELCPEMRTLLQDFVATRYAACIRYLDAARPDLLLDLHLHGHVARLVQLIRQKALVQYFSPFLSVDLGRMAEAFHTDVGALEAELTALILDKEIHARIDSQNKVLHARQVDQRAATFQRALAAGLDYERLMKMAVLRLNMTRTGFVVRAEK